MTSRFLTSMPLMAVVFSTHVALAHGTGEHILGKVRAVDESSISVETKEGNRSVSMDAKTKFEKSGASATAKDLKIGERVVIHARKEGDRLIAEIVKFGSQSQSNQSHGHDGGTTQKEHHEHSAN